MKKAEKHGVADNLDYIRLMLDSKNQLNKHQLRIVTKALGYCWTDGLAFEFKK